MRKSTAVTLILSGSLLAGCDRQNALSSAGNPGGNAGLSVTNNTYDPARGYYHAPYRAWYPHPHNYYDPASGYYYNGHWSSVPDTSKTTPSTPAMAASGRSSGSSFLSRFGFGSHGSSIHS